MRRRVSRLSSALVPVIRAFPTRAGASAATRKALVAPLLVAAVLVAAPMLAACGEGGEQAAAAQTPPPAAQSETRPPAAAPAPATEAPTPPPRHEPPLPSFEGTTLDGHAFAASDLLGKRAVVFFFNPEVPEAGPAADALAHVAPLRGSENFAIVGVALGSGGAAARKFAAAHGLDFPIVDDSSGEIAGRLGLRAPVALVGVDPDGYVIFAHGGVPPGSVPDPTAVEESQLRESLRLPAGAGQLEPTLGSRPNAPVFEAQRLWGGKPFRLADLRGKPVILMFFLYTCPHCHHALEFLRDELPKLPAESRPQLIGVSVSGSPAAVKERLEADHLDFFPVLADDDFSLRTKYGVVGGVPDIFLIDAEGNIATRIQGWRDDRDPALTRMWLAKLAGQPVPMLLHATAYSGTEACIPCHENEHTTWLLTQHASAYDTLVRHAAAGKPECIGCHVVGYGKTGGYTISPPVPYLENVGCEACHGRGGPHLSPDFVKGKDYQPVCVTCHDAKHSLGFDYATFEPRISHTANADLAKLSLAEKQKILAERLKPRPVLPTNAAYVGSDACKPCHAQEFETWSKQPHAHALAALESKHATDDPKCLACHTTAMGKPGGFPLGGKPTEHADLARVGCESCHGPGANHVGPDAARIGTIVSLGDKCDSCVILQICGGCHDAANDPGFEFAVEKKIAGQKHGTIQPAALRQGAPSAALSLPSTTWVGWLERGFASGAGLAARAPERG
jgi:peroxiredoxin